MPQAQFAELYKPLNLQNLKICQQLEKMVHTVIIEFEVDPEHQKELI